MHTDLEYLVNLKLSGNFEKLKKVRELRERSGNLTFSQGIFSLRLLLCFRADIFSSKSGRRGFERENFT